MLYFKHKNTNKIESYNVKTLNQLGAALRTDPWEQIEEPKDIALKALKRRKKAIFIKFSSCRNDNASFM